MELIGLSQRLQPALAHIHQHYAEKIDRDELARLTCLARSRFHHLFHQLTGMGVMEYLKHLRIQRAKALLLATDQPIGDVAAAIGYADPSHFSRLFTALVGCSPRSFRNRSTGIGRTEAADPQATQNTLLHAEATQTTQVSECLIIYLRSQRAAG
jgi:AraC-like DNA-binding protein